ncbi:MAG TPA: methylated-DNA--[protein]-cysteine S-methyltransferase [Blastocatellia bacterium]|jgi:O-6-methylguanine DNA methyltransferase|nr:methylated-DNA--[protein]-cysteine S-methyltransferase [Blastocatellia bacterium]
MRISYTIVDSTLGRLLVGATERGVCAVSLHDSDAVLESELARDYPKAELRREEGGSLREWVDALLSYLGGRSSDLDIPLDVPATEFQQRVWGALRDIPYGSTRTYGELAGALGYPKTAARAVGHACATNPVSLVIPCHRAVRNDGGLGGYRWGLDRKRALLAQERSVSLLFI